MENYVTKSLKLRIKNNLNELTREELIIIIRTPELSDFLAKAVIAQENPAILLEGRSVVDGFFTEFGRIYKSRVPLYPTLRGEIKKIIDAPKMLETINRVMSIKALNEGKTLDDIALNAYKMNNGFIEGYASDDWFVYVNEKNEIKYSSINIDLRAKDELEECLSNLKKSYGEETETHTILL